MPVPFPGEAGRLLRVGSFPAMALLLTLAGCGAAPPPSKPPAPREAAPSSRQQTLAVYPFENQVITDRERLDFLSHWLPDSLAVALQGAGELRLVERRELLRILEEQKLGATALASRETRLRLGRIAGAQTLLFGAFTAVGDTLQIDARVVDAASGVVLRSATVRGSPAEARALGERLAGKIADDLGVTIAHRSADAGLTDDRALEAAEHFYEGASLEKRGKKEQAIEAYRQALELNRNDEEAKRRIRRLLEGP